MATNKPRIQVTLDQEAYDALKTFSGLTGGSMSAIVSSLVTANVKTFDGLGKVIALAQSLDAGARAALAGGMSDIESGVLSSLSDLTTVMEGIGVAASEATPFPINKGVRSSNVPTKCTKTVRNLFMASNNDKKGGV